MKIYLSGKISGLFPELAEANFAKALAKVKLAYPDAEVINPMRIAEMYPRKAKEPEMFYYRRILAIDMYYLSKCNLLIVLPNGRDSEGSKAEVAFSKACGIKIIKDFNFKFQ